MNKYSRKNRFLLTKKTKNPSEVKSNFLIQLVWIAPALAFLAVFVFFAIFIALKFAFDGSGSQTGDFILSGKNFVNTLTNPDFLIAIRNSIIYSVVVVPIGLFLSLLIAKSLISIMSKRVFNFLQGLFFLPYVTSALAISMTFAFIFSPTGAINELLRLIGLEGKPWLTDSRYAIWTIVIFGIWRSLPFNILMLTTGLLKINQQYYQAASIDGLSPMKQFWKVTIPLLVPMLIYLFTIGLINSFKVFPIGLFNSYPDAARYQAQTIVFWIFQRRSEGNYGEASAGSIILMGIILIITILTKKVSKFLTKKYGVGSR